MYPKPDFYISSIAKPPQQIREEDILRGQVHKDHSPIQKARLTRGDDSVQGSSGEDDRRLVLRHQPQRTEAPLEQKLASAPSSSGDSDSVETTISEPSELRTVGFGRETRPHAIRVRHVN